MSVYVPARQSFKAIGQKQNVHFCDIMLSCAKSPLTMQFGHISSVFFNQHDDDYTAATLQPTVNDILSSSRHHVAAEAAGPSWQAADEEEKGA